MQAYWRDASLTPMFFFIDSSAVLPIFIFLFHIRFWTFLVALVVITFLSILAKFNFTPRIFLRLMKNVIAGPLKTAHPWWRS